MALIARRATGVSANRRKFAGVGLGIKVCGAGAPDRGKLGDESGARFDPAPTVRRPSRPANKLVESNSRKDKSPARRIASRTLSVIFMIFFLRRLALPSAKSKKGTDIHPFPRYFYELLRKQSPP